jgi:hypothetical protein
MLLALPEYNFQAYITEVQHTFRFGAGGGFQTQAAICAPAKTDAKDEIFGLLPLGGKGYMDAIAETQAEEAEFRRREAERNASQNPPRGVPVRPGGPVVTAPAAPPGRVSTGGGRTVG